MCFLKTVIFWSLVFIQELFSSWSCNHETLFPIKILPWYNRSFTTVFYYKKRSFKPNKVPSSFNLIYEKMSLAIIKHLSMFGLKNNHPYFKITHNLASGKSMGFAFRRFESLLFHLLSCLNLGKLTLKFPYLRNGGILSTKWCLWWINAIMYVKHPKLQAFNMGWLFVSIKLDEFVVATFPFFSFHL